MGRLFDEHMFQYSQNKELVVYGAGKMSHKACEYIENVLSRNDYILVDGNKEKWGKRFNNRLIQSPDIIDKNCFVFISTVYFHEVATKLNGIGLSELIDYVSILDIDYYEALFENKDAPRVPELTLDDLRTITDELGEKFDVREIDWLDEEAFIHYEKQLNFGRVYNKDQNKRYRRKIIEYYIVEKLLDLNAEMDVYIDIGAAGSPFAKYLREKKSVNAFAVDLEKGPYQEAYYLQEDATDMHFDDNSVDAISAQSAFEMFVGDADIRFIEEAGRVLKKGGKVCILPLYLHRIFLSTSSPNYYGKGFADKTALECIRTDCRGEIPLGRFYDVDALEDRVLKTAEQFGFNTYIYVLPDSWVEKDQFVYLKFVLLLEKK